MKYFTTTSSNPDIKLATEEVYKYLFDNLKEGKFKYINKIWNIIPDVHKNYSEFNKARRIAFKESGYKRIPVAVGIGSEVTEMFLAFELGNTKPFIIDNVNQVQPKDYSGIYGAPPLFSRAAMIGDGLYIAGTASIIGQKTVHPANIDMQTQTTLYNIMNILDEYNRITKKNLTPNDLFYTVYLPDWSNLKNVCDVLDTLIYPENVSFFHNDLCRKDLMVEIEARSKG